MAVPTYWGPPRMVWLEPSSLSLLPSFDVHHGATATTTTTTTTTSNFHTTNAAKRKRISIKTTPTKTRFFLVQPLEHPASGNQRLAPPDFCDITAHSQRSASELLNKRLDEFDKRITNIEDKNRSNLRVRFRVYDHGLTTCKTYVMFLQLSLVSQGRRYNENIRVYCPNAYDLLSLFGNLQNITGIIIDKLIPQLLIENDHHYHLFANRLTGLKSLSLGEIRPSEPMVNILCMVLQSSNSLDTLLLGVNLLHSINPKLETKLFLKLVDHGLRVNDSLTEITFSCNKIKDPYLAILVNSLVGHKKLRHLDLTDEAEFVRSETLAAVANVISHSDCQIHTLDIELQTPSNGDVPSTWSKESSLAFARALQINKSLLRLELSYQMPLNQYIFQGIASSTSLQSLELYLDRMEKQPMVAFIDILRTNTSIKDLKFIDLYAMEYEDWFLDFCTALQDNYTLKTLHMAYYCEKFPINRVGQIAHALTINSTIEKLKFSRCKFGDAGAKLLSVQLPHMKGLKILDLKTNQITPVGAMYIAQGIKDNYYLQNVEIFDARHTVGGMTSIYEATDQGSFEIQFYVELNPYRCLLRRQSLFPSGVWPYVLQRAQRVRNDKSIIYYLLRAGIHSASRTEKEEES